MTVRGRINTAQTDGTTTGNAYFVLINRSDDPNEGGPVPVVAPPWGNGYAAPARQGGQGFVGLVRYDNHSRSNSGYDVIAITNPDGTIVNPVTLGAYSGNYKGSPDSDTPPQNGQNSGRTLTPGDQNTLSFRLDLGRLPNANQRYLWINLLATNNLPQGSTDAPKIWDALGDGGDTGRINSAIRLDTTQNQQYLNSRQGQDTREPTSDVRDHLGTLVDAPDLDIIDCSLEIRSQ